MQYRRTPMAANDRRQKNGAASGDLLHVGAPRLYPASA
jgi:hypothetical protein